MCEKYDIRAFTRIKVLAYASLGLGYCPMVAHEAFGRGGGSWTLSILPPSL